MKEDVIAANLANLRQSISELKECIEKSESSENGGMSCFQAFYQKQDGQVRLKKIERIL